MAAKIRQKKLDAIAAAAMPIGQKVIAQFKTADGESTGPPLQLPGDATPEQLELLLNQLLNQVIYHYDRRANEILCIKQLI
jgi:ribosome assembly protein 4